MHVIFLNLRCQAVRRIHNAILGIYYCINSIRMSMISISVYISCSPSKALDKIREIFSAGPAFTIFLLYIFLNYSSKRFQDIVSHLMLSTSDNSRHTLSLNNNTAINIWKRFAKFCTIVSMLALLNSFVESMAYNNIKFNCTSTINFENPASFAWFGENLRCYNEQPFYLSILAVILFVWGKLLIFVWTFSDILSIVFCQAMSCTLLVFNDLIKQFYSKCSKNSSIIITDMNINDGWNEIRERYKQITNLLEKVTLFLFPLILSCYGINIYLVIDNVIFKDSFISKDFLKIQKYFSPFSNYVP